MNAISPEEREIIAVVHQFVEREVRPVARELEHANEYPGELIDRMKQLGIYGLCIPDEYGGNAVSTKCFALVTEEIARGWMSLAGAFGGHSVVSNLIVRFGTEEQKRHYLPKLATGEMRATMALTEPGGGSDLQAMRTIARRDGDEYVVNGSKIWITNARRAGLIALLCKTDPDAVPAHRGMSILLVEKVPGVEVSKDLPKLGYKGVESSEVLFNDCRVPATAVLGDQPGRGFSQMMQGLEIGRIQVAGRALGVGRAAYEDSLRYAQEREAFGVPIWQHQSIGNYLADMATTLTAARLLVLEAARAVDDGEQTRTLAGMAKLYASEVAMKIALDAVRIHGAYGYSTEYDIERYFRDAPLMIVGEGTNEVLRNVIARDVVASAPVSR